VRRNVRKTCVRPRDCTSVSCKCYILQVKAAAAPGETPWEQPCKYELQVALERLVAAAPVDSGSRAASIMFLLDGSGSVTEGVRRTGLHVH
jgi:hypothetical protein